MQLPFHARVRVHWHLFTRVVLNSTRRTLSLLHFHFFYSSRLALSDNSKSKAAITRSHTHSFLSIPITGTVEEGNAFNVQSQVFLPSPRRVFYLLLKIHLLETCLGVQNPTCVRLGGTAVLAIPAGLLRTERQWIIDGDHKDNSKPLWHVRLWRSILVPTDGKYNVRHFPSTLRRGSQI